jgi:DNA gyrase subunit A
MKGDFIKDKDKFWDKFRLLIDSNLSEEAGELGDNVLSEIQAKAILEMRLQKLTGLERDKVQGEYDELQARIAELRAILESESLQKGIIETELAEIKEKFGDARRTEISYSGGDISIEDMIADEEVVITISHLGYIKRTAVSEYKTQGRGGRGSRGSKTRDADFIEHMFVASTHNYLLFFTEQGKCHWLRGYEIPEASKTSSGRVIQNILSLPKEDKIKAYIIIKDLKDEDFLNTHNIIFCTRNGKVKKTPVEAFSRPRAGGITAIGINEDDQLLEAKLTNGNNQIFMANRAGFAIRFSEDKVRPMGRTASGVRGMTLSDDAKDVVVGMVCIDPEDKDYSILVISEKGNGKRTDFDDYRLTNRGGKGVKTMQITDKTGAVITIKAVKDDDDLMITNLSGIVIRMAVSDIRVMGRATQGVRVIRLDDDDDIADVAVVKHEESDENEEDQEVTNDEAKNDEEE